MVVFSGGAAQGGGSFVCRLVPLTVTCILDVFVAVYG